MPRAWSDAVKACRQHPRKGANKRWCSCKVGWRYRMGMPDPETGRLGKPEWSQTFPTRDAADEHQRATRKAIVDRTFTRDRGATVETFLRDWVTRKETAGKKPTTVNGYRSVVENRLIPALGRHRLGDLRPTHVQAMIDRVAEAPSLKGTKPVAAGTLVNIRAVLRSALSDAVRQELVPRNVAMLVTVPSVHRARPVSVADTQLMMFMTYIERVNDPLTVLWHVGVVYGLRRGELAALRWEAIDNREQLIYIRQELVEVAGDHLCPYCGQEHRRMLFDSPKSAAGERCYPLVPSISAQLISQKLAQDDDRELYGDDYSDHGLVSARPDGLPWRPDWISSEFKRLMLASGAVAPGGKMPSLKALRSTMVTGLHEEGTPIEVIAGVTGHADGAVTREHYLSVSAERTRTEFAALAKRRTPKQRDAVEAGRTDQQSDQRSKPLPKRGRP
jgi:integrase